ncbi:MAG: sigma-54-dependent Fis family transcriptional regulator, partial [Sphingobacteriales bacterium]
RDIIVLAEYFLNEVSHELKKNIQGFTGDAMYTLLAYSWPGNIRELKNVIRRAALMTEYINVEERALPPEIIREAHISNSAKMVSGEEKVTPLTLKSSAHEAEAATIMRVLKEVNYNRTKAAKVLNIDRKTLYNKMKLLRILE